MATKHFNQRRVDPRVFFNRQIFIAHGPAPNSKRAAVRQFIRRHPFLTMVGVGISLFWLQNLWALFDYVGAKALFSWRCELLAGGLSLVTLALYLRFRRWGQQRAVRATSQRGKTSNVWFGSPAPRPASAIRHPKSAVEITIESWLREEPIRVSEENLKLAQLPDEFLAPDALVLSLQL